MVFEERPVHQVTMEMTDLKDLKDLQDLRRIQVQQDLEVKQV